MIRNGSIPAPIEMCPDCYSSEVQSMNSFTEQGSLVIERRCNDCGVEWIDTLHITQQEYKEIDECMCRVNPPTYGNKAW